MTGLVQQNQFLDTVSHQELAVSGAQKGPSVAARGGWSVSLPSGFLLGWSVSLPPRSVASPTAQQDPFPSQSGPRPWSIELMRPFIASSRAAWICNSVDRWPEMRWLETHREQYAGQWVALDGERLVAAGSDGRRVFAMARSSGVARPLIVHLEPSDALPSGGW